MIAEFDKNITCKVQARETILTEANNATVILMEPNFDANVTLEVNYSSVTVDLSGKVTDKTGLEADLKDVPVVLSLSPQDPLFPTSLKANTDAEGSYQMQFKVIQNVEYQALLTVNSSGFEEFKQVFPIRINQSSHLTENVTLQRVVVKSTLQGSLVDQDG